MCKDDEIGFNNDITNTVSFKSFKYKAKLLRNTEIDEVCRTLRNATTAVPLKYLNNFCRSFEMALINCNVELKLRWTKHCVWSVLCVANTDNDNVAYADKNIFTIKDTKSYVLVVTSFNKR